MKILHVFPFYSIKRGGGTISLINRISNAQIESGDDVTVLTGDYMLEEELIKKNHRINVIVLKSYLNFFGIYFMPGLFKFCYKNLKNFDIIHMHLYRSIQNLIISFFANRQNIHYVIDAHGSAPRHIKSKFFKKYLFDNLFGYKMLNKSSLLIAENEMSYKEYIDLGMKDEKIKIIRPPFPIDDYKNIPKKNLFKKKYNLEEKNLILFFGRIHWIKGIDILVSAYSELLKLRDDIHLVIMGADEGFKNDLDKQIKNLNLEKKVTFTGYLTGHYKLSCIVDSEVVVQTSRYEQGAGVVIEAVLCGVPIIVSNNSGAGDDVRRLNAGYIVNFNDIENLKNTINYILENKREAKEKTYSGALNIIKNLSIKKNILKYKEAYNDLI